MVTVLTPTETAMEGDWVSAAQEALSAAYGADQPEYGAEDLRR
jgi:hypothetical protein